MADFKQFCQQFSPLTDKAFNDLTKATTTHGYRKGQYVVKKNQVCEYLYFVDHGLMKLFFMNDDKQFVMRFFSENVMFSIFDSFISQEPSKFALIALENTTLTRVSFRSMEDLCREHHCIETFYRKLLSIATTKMGKRIKEMLEADSTLRYNRFMKENKDIVQRISLSDVANYLGITQQSLSRIRKSYLPYGK